jgi:hypothetical protein
VSSHALTVTVYTAIVLAGVGLQVVSRRPGSRVPSLGGVVRLVTSSRSGRVGLVAGWAWLGLHFFAR